MLKYEKLISRVVEKRVPKTAQHAQHPDRRRLSFRILAGPENGCIKGRESAEEGRDIEETGQDGNHLQSGKEIGNVTSGPDGLPGCSSAIRRCRTFRARSSPVCFGRRSLSSPFHSRLSPRQLRQAPHSCHQLAGSCEHAGRIAGVLAKRQLLHEVVTWYLGLISERPPLSTDVHRRAGSSG